MEVGVSPIMINDGVPDREEIGESVRGMKVRKAPGLSGLKVEELKAWLCEAEAAEERMDDKDRGSMGEGGMEAGGRTGTACVP